jgi:Protein of unknown function (DUF1493).
MKEQIFNDLTEFIHKQTGSYEITVTSETSLENDLGVTGDDGTSILSH